MKLRYTLSAVLAALLGNTAQAAPFSLDYIGQNIVASGTVFNGTTVGGLSGIDYDSANGRYLAISDDRSALNPARYYDLSLNLAQFNKNSAPGAAGVTFNGVTNILTPSGSTFATNTVDPESMRLHNGSLFWTNEGQRATAGFQNPTVREMNLNGSYVRDFAVPTYYNPSGSVSALNAGDTGIRNNLAFESLTFSNDGKTLYTATENSLAQDDALPASVLNGSESRVLAFDSVTGNAVGEYVYTTDAVVDVPNPITNFATNGLVELLNIPGLSDSFIAVERSFSAGIPGTGNNIRLYLTSLSNASNLIGVDDLDNAPAYTSMTKELLLDLSTLTNRDGSALALDNIEAITWGETFNGNPTLILASDNNFSATQFTQFLGFEVKAVPLPAAFPLFGTVLLGLGANGLRRKRRKMA
ncbi:esterase-like activity of phytase family protein [Methylomonas sp. MO1]|uniref:esterase-like activity of phytase family protein n=1 Tax=Methylomonas sp. MO1 TaxID=3073619 RepID=UPI0028A4004B|nr:esterase-like activity of phytase family protein [Methylomonas sp. MO1]MDT4287978.1 esterase-like activity of phytase family protein [Methylomonas sp. MO1]